MTAFSLFCSSPWSVFVNILPGSRMCFASLLPESLFISFLASVSRGGFYSSFYQSYNYRYLDMLPTRFGNPLWFSDDDILELKGTNLYHATQLQVNNLSHFFHYVSPSIDENSCQFVLVLSTTSFQKKKLLSLYHDKVEVLVKKLLILDGDSERFLFIH